MTTEQTWTAQHAQRCRQAHGCAHAHECQQAHESEQAEAAARQAECIDAAARYLATEPRSVWRAALDHHPSLHGGCAGCGPSVPWPCIVAYSARRAEQLLARKGIVIGPPVAEPAPEQAPPRRRPDQPDRAGEPPRIRAGAAARARPGDRARRPPSAR